MSIYTAVNQSRLHWHFEKNDAKLRKSLHDMKKNCNFAAQKSSKGMWQMLL